jgi:aldehyde:ferredoxin oxidoreductase
MQTGEIAYQEVPESWIRWGGRGLVARFLLDEVPPGCDPLGPHNKLIFAPGLLAGGSVTTAGRLSVGAKSPLTRGAKEANVGGAVGDMLGKLEIKALVVEGEGSGGWHILRVSGDSAELLPGDHLAGLGTYAATDRLHEQFGPDCSITCIGQAGEGRMTGAGIATTGEAGQRSNHAARGGLGAVMGSKRLKAVVVDKPTGKAISLADAELFRTAARAFAQKLINDPKLGAKGSQHLYGTASIVGAVNEMGSLPVRNFSVGSMAESAQLRGEHLREVTLARGGEVGTRCMHGCVIACRNVYADEAGAPIVGTLQYETIALLGSNLGLSDLDQVAQLNYLCNDFGLDSIETGGALGVALEAGLAPFGDFAAIRGLLEQVGQGTTLGRVIGCGAATAGRVLGVRRVPAALGQAMPGYDPRSLKGNGVTYATSPQGADHTAGNAFGARLQVNPLGVQGQRELSLKLQIIAAMLDSTGLCLFARPPIIADPQLMVDMLNGRYGWGWTKEDFDQSNRDVLRMELEFNRRAGLTAADYRIPEYMREEPLAPHNVTFDVPDGELDAVFATL